MSILLGKGYLDTISEQGKLVAAVGGGAVPLVLRIEVPDAGCPVGAKKRLRGEKTNSRRGFVVICV